MAGFEWNHKQGLRRKRRIGNIVSIRSVRYISEAQAQELEPNGRAMFSITEPERLASLRPGWKNVFRHQFIDTEYDEKSLEFAGIDWWIASGAISPLQAITMRGEITALAMSPTQWDVICHCHAGQSRSAAVAHYIADVHGAQLLQERSPKANNTVLTLLYNPWSLIERDAFEKIMYPFWKRWVLKMERCLRPDREPINVV